jgi:hypothetical protein
MSMEAIIAKAVEPIIGLIFKRDLIYFKAKILGPQRLTGYFYDGEVKKLVAKYEAMGLRVELEDLCLNAYFVTVSAPPKLKSFTWKP